MISISGRDQIRTASLRIHAHINMESYSYKTRGTCSREIKIELDGDKIVSVTFVGGCQGNTTGISRLVAGMKTDEAINKLAGINCGGKGTSCPDQLAKALTQIKENENTK